MQQRAVRYFTLIINITASALILWLAARYLLPWTAPLMLAYAAAALLEPAVRALMRCGWRRRAASAALTVTVIALAACAIWVLTVKGAGAVGGLAERGPEIMAELEARLDALEARLAEYAELTPSGIGENICAAVNDLTEELYALPTLISQRLLDIVAWIAQTGPDALLFTVTALLGTYMISASFEKTNAFLLAQLPESVQHRLRELTADLKASFGGYLRAQLILMAMTFFELAAAFFAMHIKNAVTAAAVTALVDALPVFGTGTVLIPWAIYELLLGDAARAALLLLLWGGVNLVRSCVQAKLLGDQIGLSPLASLAAIYVGWRVWGVVGMLLLPIVLAALNRLNERGLVKLWKTV